MRAIVRSRRSPYDVRAVSSSPARAATDAPRAPAAPSGRLLLRMPPELHAELTRVAEGEGTSLNACITRRLGESVGWGDAGAVERGPSRLLPALLVANGVAVGLAAIVAIVILLVAWLG